MKFLTQRNQVLKSLKEFFAENGTSRILRSDKENDHKIKAFKEFCAKNKLEREFRLPETPEQNGVVERYEILVTDTAKCLLLESKLPKTY